MIDEIPEEKQPLIKREIPKRDKVMETRVDIETSDKVKEGRAMQVEEDVVKVGRLNIADYEKAPKASDELKIYQTVMYFPCIFCSILAQPFT